MYNLVPTYNIPNSGCGNKQFSARDKLSTYTDQHMQQHHRHHQRPTDTMIVHPNYMGFEGFYFSADDYLLVLTRNTIAHPPVHPPPPLTYNLRHSIAFMAK